MKTDTSLLFALITVFIPAINAATARAASIANDGASATSLVAAPEAPVAGIAGDPNIDRGFIQPTAMTQPAHSLTYNNYELLLHGLSYGITDRLQASVTVLAPIVEQMPFVGVASVKYRVLATPRFHLALQGSATMVSVSFHTSDAPDGSNTSNSSAYLFGAGAFASTCLRDDCSSLASVNVTYQFARSGDTDGTAHALVYGGSLVHRVAPHTKLLGEITSMAASDGSARGFDNVSGALLSYGVRLHTANIASDIGFMKPIFSDVNDPFVLGLPFINVSYRWN